MRHLLKFLPVLIIALGNSCADKHLINDKEYLKEVEKAYAERTQLASKRAKELFAWEEHSDKLEKAYTAAMGR